MSYSKLPVYILQELPDLTECIKYPIKNVQRVKYTCFDVSKRLIAFGAISGGIYVFSRSPCEFLQLIPNKDGAITRLAISPDEKHIAFANGRGVLTVTRCDQSLNGGSSLQVSKEHQGNEVTAIMWSRNSTLFAGDDIGKISVLQLQNFIAKTFQSSSQTIMSLDSRICQLDTKDCMLLVSTLTRSYVCDTSLEQYRQIGQKLRDGEYGACFVNRQKPADNGCITYDDTTLNFTEIKKYNIIDEGTKFSVSKDLENTLVCCARPSSRLWEASVDGTVQRTHQFKQVLASKPMKLVTVESYNNENIDIESYTTEDEGQSVNFPKVYSINNIIMSYKKDALYFLDIQDVDATVWYDTYKDIIDCKIYHDFLYLWLSCGSLISLRFMKIDKFLVKCYVDEKYELCAKLCALYSNYLLSNNISPKMYILTGLNYKLQNNTLLKEIENVLLKIENLKSDATQMKSGIYIVDNTFNAQTMLDDEETKKIEDTTFGTLAPETMQTLKELSLTVTDKLNSSKKVLKEKWEDLEEKMKHLSYEKQTVQEINLLKRISVAENNYHQINDKIDSDIIYKESSQKAIDNIENNILEEDKVCKSIYQYFRLSLVGKETEQSNLIPLIESSACDITEIYSLMLLLEKYCLHVGALEESKYVPNKIFLTYLNISQKRDELLDVIVTDETLYKYFVDSCISVNMKTQKLSNLGCECGFPLPFDKANQTPAFSELIDDFIERQWSYQTRDQCYEICKRMPYLWRKIIYLRRNEDLLNVLQLILQMLDENLLHSFLPQFTLDTWDKAIQLYATLNANMCLNCNKKFDHISVKETLSWDDLGALIIKSVGGTNAIQVIEKHAKLIETGGLTMKFYHTCLLVTLYEKYDSTITSYLTDTIYDCYEFEDSRKEVCNLLRSTIHGELKNTALPLTVAANTSHWGLSPLLEVQNSTQNENDSAERETHRIRMAMLPEIIDNLAQISGVTDCVLCGLPLQNAVLVRDGGIWAHRCGHVFHGACLDVNKLKLCPSCPMKRE